MRHISSFFAYGLFFVVLLISFTPKEGFYYLFEQEIREYDVVVSNELLEEHFISLEVKNLHVNLKGVEAAEIESVEITLLGLYNALHFKNIRLSALSKAYLPAEIDSIEVHYSIVDPLHIKISGEGKFGTAVAEIELLKRELLVTLNPSKIMQERYKKSLRYMKKSQNGEYSYAKTLQ